MTSVLKVDTLQNLNSSTIITQTNATTLTLGTSGQTISIPAGATINTSTINVTTVVLAAGFVGTPSLTTSGDTNTGIFFPSADTIAFTEGGTEAMRINSDGNLALTKNIGLGGATPTTSGTGITFPASVSGSTDANTLDDYEEGTWTPAWQQSTSDPTVTYANQLGTYTRIGNLVYVNIRIGNSAFTAGVGDLRISGLPFTVANDNTFPAASLGFKTNFTTNGPDYGRFISSSQLLELYIDNNTSETQIAAANVGATSAFIMSGCYRV